MKTNRSKRVWWIAGAAAAILGMLVGLGGYAAFSLTGGQLPGAGDYICIGGVMGPRMPDSDC